jgi:hypothetical protein
MASELKPSTLAKKRVAFETLPAFLARMTLVWEERQRRLAQAPARAAEAARRSLAKALEKDPEGTRARRREAVRRYEENNRAAIRAREAKQRDRLAAALDAARELKRAEKVAQRDADKARKAVERDAKRVNRAEGYPKHQATSPACPGAVTSTWRGPVDRLSRAWFEPGTERPACPEKQAACAAPEASGFGRRAAKRRESEWSAVSGAVGPPLARLLALN